MTWKSDLMRGTDSPSFWRVASFLDGDRSENEMTETIKALDEELADSEEVVRHYRKLLDKRHDTP